MKTAVITGAGKGIGRGIAKRLCHAGYAIAVCSRSEHDLKSLRHQLLEEKPGAEILTYKCDLGIPDEANAFAQHILNAWAHIDVLVNNAGSYAPGRVYDEPDGSLDDMLANNLYSAYYITRALIPVMQKRRQGRIINISSRAGIEPYPNGGSYSISKYAMTGFGANLRMELQPFNIGVTNLFPGAVHTPSWEGVDIPKEEFIQVSDIAELVNTICHLSPNAVVEELVIRPMRGDM